MLLYWLIVVILACDSAFGQEEHRPITQQIESNTCTTANGTAGTCISIKNCQSLIHLLQTRGQEPAVSAYLNQTQCGTDGQWPKVCCPGTVAVGTIEGGESTDYSQCGKANPKISLIPEYSLTSPGERPWMVALGYRSPQNPGPLFKCDGSLLSNRWVITAAHCINSMRSFVLTTVRVGDFDLNDTVKDNATPIDVPFDQIFVHPEFSSNPILNDIALIRLKNPVTFTEFIRPICILSEVEHKSDGFYSTKFPYFTGWSTNYWQGANTALHETQAEISEKAKCVLAYSESNRRLAVIDERVICVDIGRKDDTCLGDSSGIMVIPIKSTFYLAGIESFGVSGCINGDYPRVYTKVAHFADWIKRTAQL